MKKVCHVTSVHPPEDGRIFRRACISSVRAGYDTYLVEQGASYDKNNVHIIGIGEPDKEGRFYRMTRFAYKAYKAARAVDADIYQLHDPELLPYALKLKKRGKAVVFDSHENYAEQLLHKTYLSKHLSKIVAYAYNRYSSIVYSKIDGITYPGNDGEATPLDGKCKIVVPTDNLPWLSELYDKYDSTIEKEARTVCYIGAIEESRGITQIVEAAYDANCVLYLAGSFSSEDYQKKLQGKPEYQCVRYLGVLDRTKILSLLQKTEVGLCILLDVGQYHKMNNLPSKVYEYMSLGLPVILNSSPYNEKIIEELKFGLCVDPMNHHAIVQAITDLLLDQKLRNELGLNGRKAVKQRFCWDIAQHNLIDMYKAILGE